LKRQPLRALADSASSPGSSDLRIRMLLTLPSTSTIATRRAEPVIPSRIASGV
jgi:hypothetical protein